MSKEMKVAVVTGVLAFVGAIAGNYMVAHLDEQKSDRQFRQTFRAHMLDRRLTIFEQCTHARAQLPRAKVLKEYQDTMLEYLNSDKSLILTFRQKGPAETLLQIQKDMNLIQTEYMGCLLNSRSSFGAKTRDAAQALVNQNAYDPDDANQAPLFNNLSEAMIKEAGNFDNVK
jgi:hypothetical protein